MSAGTLEVPSLFRQTLALLWKNALLKWRRKWETVVDLAFILFIFFLGSIMRYDTSNVVGPATALGKLDEFENNLTIGYMVTTSSAKEIMQRLKQDGKKKGITVEEFKKEEIILQNISINSMVGVTFNDPFEYCIQHHYTLIPTPNDHLTYHGECYNGTEDFCMAARYWTYGLLYIQASIDSAIIEMTTGGSVGSMLTSIQVTKMKSIEEAWANTPDTWKFVIPMCLSYTSLTYLLSCYVAAERKEMREIMRTMGMMDSAFWLSWGLLYAVYVLLIANLLSLLVTTFMFIESSYNTILLLFTLYGLASISFCFLLSTIFRNLRVMVLVGFLITLFGSTSGLSLLIRNLPKSLEVLLSIFHPFAFAMGLLEALHLEKEAQGVFFLGMVDESFQILCSYISLTLDTILYMILTLYLDKVLPDQHGMKHEPLFFARSSFWRRRKTIPPLSMSARQKEPDSGAHIEKFPSSLDGKEAIRINNVKKNYKGEEEIVEALKGLNFDIYEGQITALIGHTGAGKTTLLNILSGMCAATSGSSSIYNYNHLDRDNIEDMRRIVGFCPESDVKFDPLTVKENLKVFAQIKGIPSCRVEHEIKKVTSCLQLTDIQNREAETLSAGQRRMLTLGIALLGDPKVLLLDEPTVGLDPFSRHQVWAYLKEMKADRVTLMSSQFMDEADILADRLAVISGGHLRCLGSSHFLKRKWGIGYNLRMHVTSSCDPEAARSLIQQHISSAKLSTQNDQELTFTLPFHSMDAFPDLLSHLEERVGREIISYGVSSTTLNDVFLKLEEEVEADRGGCREFTQDVTSREDSVDDSPVAEDPIELMTYSGQALLSDWALWKQQVLAVARMRLLKLKHNKTSFWAIFLMMLCFITPLLFFTTVMYNQSTMHRRELESNMYFMRAGERDSRYHSRLLIFNNTGSPIEDFTEAVRSQDIVIEVTNGPYNPDTTRYKGAIEVSTVTKGYQYTIIGNLGAINSLPVLLNIISNSVLKMFKSNEHIRIWRDSVHPNNEEEDKLDLLFESVYYMLFATAMTPLFAMSSIEDTRMKARAQLHISGLFPSAYWCGLALVDIPFYWLLLFLMIAIAFLFCHPLVLSFWLSCLLIVEILGYGAAAVLYVYVIAFIFRNGKSHHSLWTFFFILIPVLPRMLYHLADIYIDSMDSILWSFLFPTSTLVHTLYLILFIHMDVMYYEDPAMVALSMLWCYIHIVLFSGILWCLEWKYGRRSLKKDPVFRTSKQSTKVMPNPSDLEDADEDVLAERERVKGAKTSKHQDEPVVIVSSLRKEFDTSSRNFRCQQKKIIGTKNISFCVRKGEILGVLGPNGAGKTTTLSMIAGELIPTAGEVQLCETVSSIHSSETIGYCCQESPLWPDMTIWEHLEIYAAIKGMKEEDVNVAVRRLAEALDLKDHLNKPAKKLSNGISRKVCLAISMLGNPTIVLLDEPSTGLDPKARQKLWKPIRMIIKNKQRGAILTTHYMEEAEAVCDRVAIMVSGKLRCIGSTQHLKSRFGKGYQLEIKVKDPQRADLIHQDIIRMFPLAARQDRFSSLLVYKIPMDDIQSLPRAFSLLEEAKRVHNFEEYSFSQPTLQQVFLELMKEQEMDDFD